MFLTSESFLWCQAMPSFLAQDFLENQETALNPH
jgi:hypothetical protein